MKRILLLISFCVVSICGYSQTEDIIDDYDAIALKQKADSLCLLSNKMFYAKDYEDAINSYVEVLKLYEKAVGKENSSYASALYNLFVTYYSSDDYEAAICLSKETVQIYEIVFGKNSSEYAGVLEVLAHCFYMLNDYAKAAELQTEVLAIKEQILDKKNPDYVATLNNLAGYNYYNGCYEEAISRRTEALNIEGNIYGKESEEYAISLQEIAQYNSKLYHWDEAARMEAEASNIYGKVYGKDSEEYTNSLCELAHYNFECSNYTEAARIGAEALTVCERVYGRESEEYFRAAKNLAVYYGRCNLYVRNHDEQDYSQKEKGIKKVALDVCEKVYGKNTTQYAETLTSLLNCYGIVDTYQEAIILSKGALDIYEDIYGKVSEEYSWLLSRIAKCYEELGDYTEAIKFYTESLYIDEKISGHDSNSYASDLNILARCYSEKGNYSEAIRLSTEALNVKEKVYGKESWEYTNALGWLGSFYYDLGNYSEALRVSKEALGISKVNFITDLSRIALCNYALGNYEEAFRNRMELKQFLEELEEDVYDEVEPDSIAGPDYLLLLSHLAESYSSLGKDTIAHELHSHVVAMCEKYYRDQFYYGWSLEELSEFYSSIGNTRKAAEVQARVVDAYEEIYGKGHPDYATSLYKLSLYNCWLHDYKKATEQCEEALLTIRNTLGVYSYKYGNALFVLSNCHFGQNDTKALNQSAFETSEVIGDMLQREFRILPTSARSILWSNNKVWYEKLAHEYAYKLSSDTLSALGYNAVLLSKGLLLNSEIEFSKLIQESGDSEVIAMYDYLRTLRLQINKLLEKPISERFANVDSLERIAQAKESALIERSKVYGDFTKNLVITWDQVQEKLTNKDAAVEFVSFPLNADSTMYIAYTLRKGWEYPRMIPLFEEKQLLGVQQGDRYTTDSISRLVWKPLDDVMQGVERVYFAPSGELYNIAIESIPSHEDGGETLVGEHLDFYRLSSTRELALIKDESRWDEAAVYGGLQYGMSVKGMIEEDGKYEKTAGQKRGNSTPSYYVVREDSIGRGDRDNAQGLEYLEGTKREAEAITHDLERKAIDARLFTDSIGTETSFKALGGKKTTIIHIGTHGFFNDRKKKYKEDKLQLLGIDQQAKVIEDDALTRSGLYFAGADNVILNGLSAVPDSIDDGRLTAAEIAQLDLRELDMVVLSACQTGLGEITGDGVFGLQRGFKKAGAQTIVMSLWNVDDEATRLFMTKFFETMKLDKEGHPTNKHEAFLAAQRYLRDEYEIEQTRVINGNLTASQIRRLEREGQTIEKKTITEKVKPYKDPKYWAAFIMLDGIN